MIGEEDDTESLQSYSNQVMKHFFNNQLAFFTNGQRIIGALIIQYGDMLDSVIISNDITIFDMPLVQLSALLLKHDEVFKQLKKN